MGEPLSAYQVMYDTMGGWKTVSYFNRFKHIKDGYSAVTAQHTASKIKAYLYSWLTLTIQDCVLDIGLFAACFYAIYQVVYSGQSVGYFVMLIIYWAFLAIPSIDCSKSILPYLKKQLLKAHGIKPEEERCGECLAGKRN